MGVWGTVILLQWTPSRPAEVLVLVLLDLFLLGLLARFSYTD